MDLALDVISLVLAGSAVVLGGGGFLSLAQFKRQVAKEAREENREIRSDIFGSYREQIELSEKDGLTEEVSRLRQAFRVMLGSWREQQNLESLAPQEIQRTGPSISTKMLSELQQLLVSTQGLPPGTVSAEGHRLRGNAFFEIENYISAVDEYSEAIRLDPGFAKAYNGQGAAFSIQGQILRAIENNNEAIRLDAGNARADRNRGIAYGMLGQTERAIEDFNEAIGCSSLATLDPEVAQSYYNRGIAYQYLGQHQRAIEDYDEAIRLNPEYANAYQNRGISYCPLGKDEKAQADFERAAELRSVSDESKEKSAGTDEGQ